MAQPAALAEARAHAQLAIPRAHGTSVSSQEVEQLSTLTPPLVRSERRTGHDIHGDVVTCAQAAGAWMRFVTLDRLGGFRRADRAPSMACAEISAEAIPPL